MKATIDISLYPLNSSYKDEIIIFVQQLKKYPDLKIEVNGMSTQIFGDYDQIMTLMQKEMKVILNKTKAVFILKIAANERTKDNLPEALK